MVDIKKYIYCHKLGGLRQERFILSLFWKLGVKSQSIGKAVPSPETLEKNPLHAFLPASGS